MRLFGRHVRDGLRFSHDYRVCGDGPIAGQVAYRRYVERSAPAGPPGVKKRELKVYTSDEYAND